MVQNDLVGIIGQSVLFALIINPLTIVHIFVNLYVRFVPSSKFGAFSTRDATVGIFWRWAVSLNVGF